MSVCHHRAHAARGSNFLLLRQKKVTKEKATPTFAPCVALRDLKRKRRAVRNSLRSNNEPPDHPSARRFHSKSRGRIHGAPVEPIFDRVAIRITKTWMLASDYQYYAPVQQGKGADSTPIELNMRLVTRARFNARSANSANTSVSQSA